MSERRTKQVRVSSKEYQMITDVRNTAWSDQAENIPLGEAIRLACETFKKVEDGRRFAGDSEQ